MRSKVVSAMVRLPRPRAYAAASASFCHDAAKRESSISAGRVAGRRRTRRTTTRRPPSPARRPRPRRRGAARMRARRVARPPAAVELAAVAARLIARSGCACSNAVRWASPQNDAAASRQRLVARQVNAAMRAGEHRLRRSAAAAALRGAAPAGVVAPRSSQSRTTTTTRTAGSSSGSGRRAAGAGRPRARSASRRRRAAAAQRRRRRQRVAFGRASRRRAGRRAGRRRRASRGSRTPSCGPSASGSLNQTPRTIAAERTTKPAATKRKRQPLEAQQRHACAARIGGSGAPSHLPLGAIEQQRVQHGDAEQAVRGDAEQPVQRRPDRRGLRMHLAREEPGEDDRRRRRARASARRAPASGTKRLSSS